MSFVMIYDIIYDIDANVDEPFTSWTNMVL